LCHLRRRWANDVVYCEGGAVKRRLVAVQESGAGHGGAARHPDTPHQSGLADAKPLHTCTHLLPGCPEGAERAGAGTPDSYGRPGRSVVVC